MCLPFPLHEHLNFYLVGLNGIEPFLIDFQSNVLTTNIHQSPMFGGRDRSRTCTGQINNPRDFSKIWRYHSAHTSILNKLTGFDIIATCYVYIILHTGFDVKHFRLLGLTAFRFRPSILQQIH